MALIRRFVNFYARRGLPRSDHSHERHEVVIHDDHVLAQSRGRQFASSDVLEEGVGCRVHQFRGHINV